MLVRAQNHVVASVGSSREFGEAPRRFAAEGPRCLSEKTQRSPQRDSAPL